MSTFTAEDIVATRPVFYEFRCTNMLSLLVNIQALQNLNQKYQQLDWALQELQKALGECLAGLGDNHNQSGGNGNAK